MACECFAYEITNYYPGSQTIGYTDCDGTPGSISVPGGGIGGAGNITCAQEGSLTFPGLVECTGAPFTNCLVIEQAVLPCGTFCSPSPTPTPTITPTPACDCFAYEITNYYIGSHTVDYVNCDGTPGSISVPGGGIGGAGNITCAQVDSLTYFGLVECTGAPFVNCLEIVQAVLPCGSAPCSTPTPTPTISASPTQTPTPSITATQTQTPTPSITATQTQTPTPSITASQTQTQTQTPTPSITASQTQTQTQTPSPTPSTTPCVEGCVEYVDVNVTFAGTIAYLDCNGVTQYQSVSVGAQSVGVGTCVNKDSLAGSAAFTIVLNGPCCGVIPVTPSQTPTNTISPTQTPTITASPTQSPTNTPTTTPTTTITATPSSTPLVCGSGYTTGNHYYYDCCGNLVTGSDIETLVALDYTKPYVGIVLLNEPASVLCATPTNTPTQSATFGASSWNS